MTGGGQPYIGERVRRREDGRLVTGRSRFVDDLDIRFHVPYDSVRDTSRGTPWTTWFVGGRINLATACLGRWRDDAQWSQQQAIVAETEAGEVRTLTYRQLAVEVDRLAHGLRAEGGGPGDVVAVFLPMVPEAVVAAYAIALVGAIYMPVFSGFAAGAVASRLQDARDVLARVLA